MSKFLDALLDPLGTLLSLFAFLFWMICWAGWQVMRGVRWLVFRD